jgi:glycosyltransferase involved in cell wall biosynthesis
VVTVHDLTVITNPEWYPWRERALTSPWLARSIRSATALVAVSDSTRHDIERIFGRRHAQVHVIPEAAGKDFHIPVAPSRVDAARVLCGLPPRANGGASHVTYWLFVGQLAPRKNPLSLVDAYADVLNSLPEPRPRLVLAGQAGPLSRAVSEHVDRLGLSDNVIAAGWVADLPALVAGAELLVCPSLHEGFGLPVAEAMACGTPVVAARTGGLPALVGSAGILCAPTRAGIAEALAEAAGSPERRQELARRGREAAAHLTWARTARETALVYADALARVAGS